MKDLYFIALIPPDPLSKQITELKFSFAEKYGSIKSLNSPPHITLIPPFESTDEQVIEINKKLKQTVQKYREFRIEINGFGAFRQNVIFLKIQKNKELAQIRQHIEEYFADPVVSGFEKGRSFSPHITLAFRDLSRQKFLEAWSIYREETFEASFRARSIFVLKHNGKHWDIHAEILFAG